MKTNTSEISKKAKRLVMIAKDRNLIKSHTIAFKEFPVEEEEHKGRPENYKK